MIGIIMNDWTFFNEMAFALATWACDFKVPKRLIEFYFITKITIFFLKK